METSAINLGKSHRILTMNTLAFTVCFAVWTLNGVLATFLSDKGVFPLGPVELGWLLGIPILTGSIFRLPIGVITDRIGGKWVFVGILLFCAVSVFLLSFINSISQYIILSFCFGMAGTGFAVGIAYTSVWYPKEWQGRALGIFGMGNAGAALTTLFAPTLLNKFTDNGTNLDGWRMLPKIYALILLVMAILFILLTENKKPNTPPRTISKMLEPLKSVRVWRFGLYYFLVFGCFVAFSQWLVPYFVNVYETSLVVAGIFASIFSFPSGVIRALGGWMSDKWGARQVMIWVFQWSIVISALLIFPRMTIITPGKGIMAAKNGKVVEVTNNIIKVDSKEYLLKTKQETSENEKWNILPTKISWQEPVVQVGEEVKKKQLLARGVTQVKFEANMWIYGLLVTIIGIVWGIGKAAVYKYIPDYFPNDVGAVGGMVGVIGGLGGFICPILFGYLLDWTGLWTSCWMLMLVISIICYWWLRKVINAIVKEKAPQVAELMERNNGKK
ncbi:MAG: hypothetical protein OHK0036_03270 [Bacteroidia bacterium]